MVPKAVQDAGYTAVGLGVLVLQQVQGRARRGEDHCRPGHEPPRRPPRLPGPIGEVIELGKTRLAKALRPTG